jgi:hypothetical protein
MTALLSPCRVPPASSNAVEPPSGEDVLPEELEEHALPSSATLLKLSRPRASPKLRGGTYMSARPTTEFIAMPFRVAKLLRLLVYVL